MIKKPFAMIYNFQKLNRYLKIGEKVVVYLLYSAYFEIDIDKPTGRGKVPFLWRVAYPCIPYFVMYSVYKQIWSFNNINHTYFWLQCFLPPSPSVTYIQRYSPLKSEVKTKLVHFHHSKLCGCTDECFVQWLERCMNMMNAANWSTVFFTSLFFLKNDCISGCRYPNEMG